MSYMHIDNLYKNQDILMFRECYAMEKIHGTSAHIAFKPGSVSLVNGHTDGPDIKLFNGGSNRNEFVKLFDMQKLADVYQTIYGESSPELVIYGEAYGGKLQGMKETYGPDLKFVAFEVRFGEKWLNVPNAEMVVKHFGLEFVHWIFIPTDLAMIDRARDAESEQANRNGMGHGRNREGVVLRPPIEVIKPNGGRIIAKHKRPEFCETQTKREVKPEKAVAEANAKKIAEEWVTRNRLQHVIDQIDLKGGGIGIEMTGDVIKVMIADVVREAGEEIMDSKEARKAIGARAAQMFKAMLAEQLHDGEFVESIVADDQYKEIQYTETELDILGDQ